MNELDKKNHYQTLLMIYRDLFTAKQKEILTQYFEDDLSLSEIADNLSISKAAVFQTLGQSIIKLDRYEDRLKIVEQNNMILAKLNMLETESSDNKKIIDEIKEIIENGI